MEIHKDYCIVLTKNGQFLKRKIPAGVFEVGDEIVIDQELAFYEPQKTAKSSWVGRFVATASIVVVIIVGVVLGVRFAKRYSSSGEVDFSSEYTVVGKEAQEEEAGEAMITGEEEEMAEEEEAEEEVIAAVDEEKEGTVVYTDIYFLNKKDWVEEKIRGILFSYMVADDTGIQMRIENISSMPDFNGNFKLYMLKSDRSVTRVIIIPFENFAPGDIYEDSFSLSEMEKSFRLEVFENF